jgi:hypothetical protein
MPRNGSGLYELPDSVNPVVANTTITDNWANTTTADIATAISGSVAADGQTPMSQPLRLASGTESLPGLSFNLSPGTGVYYPAANTLGVSVNGDEKVRVDSSGNLSVGNSAANQKLDVTGNVRFGNGTEIGELTTQTGYVNVGARSNHPLSLITNNVERLRITAAGVIQDAAGLELGYRRIPRVTTFDSAARGSCVAVTGTVTIPANTYAAGDTFSFYNNSASTISVEQGSGLTLRLVGTSLTGSRSVTQRGFFTVWFNSATEAVIMGGGVT